MYNMNEQFTRGKNVNIGDTFDRRLPDHRDVRNSYLQYISALFILVHREMELNDV